jgi:hypothetical protein
VLIELIGTQEGGSEWLGKRHSPVGEFVSGTRFLVKSLCGFGFVGLGAVEPQDAVPLGAGILPVEHTIHRWRVGAAQHTP